jgi:hypothetical protein
VALLENLDSKRALLLSFMEAVAQADRSPELREQFARQYRHVRDRVAELVVASLHGELDAEDPRARAIASFVIATCDGLALQWMLDPGDMPSAEQFRAGLEIAWSTH